MVKNIDVTIKFLSKELVPLLYQAHFFVKVDGLYLNFFKEFFIPLYISKDTFLHFTTKTAKIILGITPRLQAGKEFSQNPKIL